MAENILKERCEHQVRVSTLIYRFFDPEELKQKDPRLAGYLYHALVFFVILAVVFTRLNDTREADRIVGDMWKDLKEINEPVARRILLGIRIIFWRNR